MSIIKFSFNCLCVHQSNARKINLTIVQKIKEMIPVSLAEHRDHLPYHTVSRHNEVHNDVMKYRYYPGYSLGIPRITSS